jgi:hypothetical protein
LTGGDYPGLGQWFVQLWDGDEVAARVYGNDREAINRRVAVLNTPPAAPDLQAELEATNRQVEILSDALAEARREVAALKAVQPVAFFDPQNGFYWAKPTKVTAPLAVAVEPMPLYTTPQEIMCSTGLCHYKPAAAVQSLPFGVGGGLVAIKTLLSRDPCVHANTAIEMIDAILKEHPAAQRPWVGLTDEEKQELVSDEIGRVRDYEDYADAIEAKLKEKNT